MKLKNSLIIGAALFVAVFVSGCVTANPDKSPGQVAYIIAPGLTNAASMAQGFAATAAGIAAATPLAPVAPSIPGTVAGFFALLTLISGGLAAYKNNQATTQKAAAASLAATVTTLNSSTVPAISTAINHAAANDSSGAVAEHLAAAANPVQL